jgi:CubicO group peptidase (beta-lactamase class C family)
MEVVKVAVVLAGSPVSSLLGGRLAALARRHKVPAAQLAIHHAGRTVAVEVGEAEYGSGRRVGPDTAVPIGSITKCFTATAALVLVADGDLDLDAPVADHLSGLGGPGAELTLRQLLSHTGGLPAGPDLAEAPRTTVRRYLAEHCREDSLVLAPGTGFSYSNLGYVLVGELIATITGMDWWDAVTSIVLRPLGIEPAAIVGPGRSCTERPVASGHAVNASAGRVRSVRQELAPAEAAAGALAMSATDLVELGRLHLDPSRSDLLPDRYLEQMRQPVPEAEPFGLADGWGLGLALFDNDGVRWAGHDGNADGTACYLRIDPVGGWAVALTTNANTGMGLWQDVLVELAGTELPVGAPRVPYPPSAAVAPPAQCAGTYANGDVEYEVVVRGGTAYLSVDGAAFVRVTCHDDLVFSLRDPASGRQVVGGWFVRDPRSGRVHALQMAGRLASRVHAATVTTRQRIA